MKYAFLNKRCGIGGKLFSPEDFIVEEVIDKKFTRKFERIKNSVVQIKGPYTLYLIKKTGMTTSQAIKNVSRHFDMNEKDIGYAGLKDKFAVTSQYITMKKEAPNTKIGGIEIIPISKTNRHISIGDLAGNKFTITLHGCKNLDRIDKIISHVKENGLPNYFGPQRFGKYENNHIIGKLTIKRQFEKALFLINDIYNKKFTSMNHVERQKIKFFINAYQSWIFNESIKCYIKAGGKPAFAPVSIPGSNTKFLGNKIDKITMKIMKSEKISQEDFSIRDLSMSCIGTERGAFMKINDIGYKISGNDVILSFTLQKGSYATIVLEYMK